MNSSFKFFSPTLDQPNLPLLLFFPGMDGTGRLLHKQVEGLQKFFNLRCLSIPTDDRSDWQTLTTSVTTLMEEEWQKLRQPDIYLCAESFGACLALSVAVNLPKLLKQLILINPASSFSQCPWLGWGIPLTPWIPKFVYPYSSLALLPWLASLERIAKSDRQALLTAMKSVPGEVVSWRLALLQSFSISKKQLNRFNSPVLLIASERDRLLPSVQESLRLSRQFPDAQLLVLPESGHACLLEKDINLDQILAEQLKLKTNQLLFN